jgi:hypothetical protein
MAGRISALFPTVLMWGAAGNAYAAELRVPQDYPTVAAAVGAAAAPDTVLLDVGTFRWDPGSVARSFPPIHGSGSDTVLTLDRALRVSGSAALRSLTLDAPTGAVMIEGGSVEIEQVDTHHGGTVSGGPGRVVIRNLRVEGARGRQPVVGGGLEALEIRGLRVVDSDLPTVIFVSASSGTFVIDGLEVVSSKLDQAAAWIRPAAFQVLSSAFLCSESKGAVIVGERVELDGVALWNWRTEATALVEVGEVTRAAYVTVGAQSTDTVFTANRVGELSDAVFAGSMASSVAPSRTLRVRHLAGTRSVVDGSVEVEPKFWGTSQVDSCEELTLFPDRGSPLLDAGDPGRRDRDGSPSDLGATGGPYGVQLVQDVDGDRCPAPMDCDDEAASQRPGNAEVWYDGINADCDGADDFDQDRDGFQGNGGEDCDDLRPEVRPGALDPCADGLDGDCDGFDGEDCDSDGFISVPQGGEDCDDADAQVYPGAAEDVGAQDRDCDGVRDPRSELEPLTCATGTGATPVGLLAAIAALRVRRRREP